MLYFKPIPKLTIASVLAFALLIGLGVWQIQRLHWKLGLIAEAHTNLAAPPLTLAQALALGPKAEYHRITLSGRFDNAHEAYVFATGPEGGAVYHVLTPFILADGRAVMIDRGIIPQSLRDPRTRQAGQLSGDRQIEGVWRLPDSPGLFTPAPDLKARVWYDRDVAAIARADGIGLAAPAVIEAGPAPNPGGWPKGGQTVVYFYNEHLQYAITWFALAAGLLVIYLAYHRAQGRLGFR